MFGNPKGGGGGGGQTPEEDRVECLLLYTLRKVTEACRRRGMGSGGGRRKHLPSVKFRFADAAEASPTAFYTHVGRAGRHPDCFSRASQIFVSACLLHSLDSNEKKDIKLGAKFQKVVTTVAMRPCEQP